MKCIHCLRDKPVSDFHVKRNGTLGVRCKNCQVNLNRAATKFRQANREKLKLEMREYRAANPEAIKANNHRSYLNNIENHRATGDRYTLRRRAAIKATEKPMRKSDWEKLLTKQNHRCYYCGANKPLAEDHVIPLSKNGSHSVSNIVAACKSCNSKKQNKTPEEFAKQIGRLLI